MEGEAAREVAIHDERRRPGRIAGQIPALDHDPERAASLIGADELDAAAASPSGSTDLRLVLTLMSIVGRVSHHLRVTHDQLHGRFDLWKRGDGRLHRGRVRNGRPRERRRIGRQHADVEARIDRADRERTRPARATEAACRRAARRRRRRPAPPGRSVPAGERWSATRGGAHSSVPTAGSAPATAGEEASTTR